MSDKNREELKKKATAYHEEAVHRQNCSAHEIKDLHFA